MLHKIENKVRNVPYQEELKKKLNVKHYLHRAKAFQHIAEGTDEGLFVRPMEHER